LEGRRGGKRDGREREKGRRKGKEYLSFKFYLLLVVVRRVPFRKTGFPSAFVSTFVNSVSWEGMRRTVCFGLG